jgi:hypothetical protein
MEIKSPEELAEEYADLCVTDACYPASKAGFLAGYQAASPQWISVKDRLPGECAGLLIVYHASLKEIGTSYYDEDMWCSNPWPITSDGITHWMPLPNPPTEDSK